MELKRSFYANGNVETECTVIKVKCETCDGTGKSPGKNYCFSSCESGFESKMNGLFKGWYKNGQLCSEFNFLDDEKHGLFKEWFANGQLRNKAKYENGNCTYLEEYHLNGTLVRKGSYEIYEDESGYMQTREIGVWEYFDAKSGQKLNKNE